MCIQHFIKQLVPNIVSIFFILFSFCFMTFTANAGKRGIDERDYIFERELQFKGSTPIAGEYFTVTQTDPKWPQQVTFSMKKVSSFLVKVEAIQKPAGIIMSVSRASSPRILKSVWAHDNIQDAISFWTNRYYIPSSDCDPTGCPKIRFQATQGTVGIVIIEIKKSEKAYIK